MTKELTNEIIIGNKEIDKYLFISLSIFEKSDKVILNACGNNIMKLERIVKLLSNIGIQETNRISSTMYNNIPHIKCEIINNARK